MSPRRARGRKVKRDRRGRFMPGYSGNPAGRPRDMERRRRFINAYVRYFGWPTKSARAAGCPERGVRVAAYRLMREPDVRAVIEAEWQAQLEQWERERREDELEQELAWRWERQCLRARLFR